MDIVEVIKKVRRIRAKLPGIPSNLIDTSLDPVPPYEGKGSVKLIIIGQDPTVRKASQRGKIKCTLNLDKKGVLKTYIESICLGLDLSLDNVYATNVFKYFYDTPPSDTPEVLKAHLDPNLKLLKKELAAFKSCPIITLGEPVLRLLAGDKKKVRNYWNYDKKCGFNHVVYYDNKLDRCFFPFPHQPSMRKDFYKTNFDNYLDYVKENIKTTF
jgi:uracil-DNA glycosylase